MRLTPRNRFLGWPRGKAPLRYRCTASSRSLAAAARWSQRRPRHRPRQPRLRRRHQHRRRPIPISDRPFTPPRVRCSRQPRLPRTSMVSPGMTWWSPTPLTTAWTSCSITTSAGSMRGLVITSPQTPQQSPAACSEAVCRSRMWRSPARAAVPLRVPYRSSSTTARVVFRCRRPIPWESPPLTSWPLISIRMGSWT